MDNQPASTDKDYYAKLPVGEHQVELETSDPEPDQIYPVRQLFVKQKGVNYCAGRLPGTALPTPGVEEMNEQLGTIHDELGCNAIIIYSGGEFEDNLLECATLAVGKGFDMIYVQPRYIDSSISDLMLRTGSFAKRLRPLSESAASIAFCAGHELSMDTAGIIPGDTYAERTTYIMNNKTWTSLVQKEFPPLIQEVMQVCRDNYGREVAYAASSAEMNLVPWADPIFESVNVDLYVSETYGLSESLVLSILSGLKRFGKPVNSTEWGCPTFTGAGPISSAWSVEYAKQQPYDEDEQANYIQQYCETLNSATVNGSFYTLYNDDFFPRGYGLYNGMKRKKGFYIYKSYQRVS
jgi:hypothetical protein